MSFWTISWCFKLLLLLAGFIVISLAPAIQMDLGAWNGGVSRSDCDQACTYTSKGGVPTLNSTLSVLYKGCYDTGTLPNSISCGESWASQGLLQFISQLYLHDVFFSIVTPLPAAA